MIDEKLKERALSAPDKGAANPRKKIQKIGQKMAENLFQTRHKSGTLDVKTDDGAAAMLRYQTSGDYVIFATVPYSDIYHMRNVVVGWIAAGGVLMAVVSCLSLRMQLLREEKKEK